MSVADLVDPKIVSPDAADARRIKSLVQLSGEKADPSLFYPLAGGQAAFERICRPEETDDLQIGNVGEARDQAGTLRRRHARREDESQQARKAMPRPARKRAQGVDLSAESDADKLRDVLADAIRESAKLASQATEAARIERTAFNARVAIEKAEKSYSGPRWRCRLANARCCRYASCQSRSRPMKLRLNRRQLLAEAKQAEAFGRASGVIAVEMIKECKALQQHEATLSLHGARTGKVATADTIKATERFRVEGG